MIPRSLVLLALLLAANASQDTPKIRKSLKFGYQKPYSKFVVVDHRPHDQSASSSFAPVTEVREDAFDTAAKFVESLSHKSLHESDDGFSYHLRGDSYTDPTTGVSHVYFKQRYFGTEVEGGVVNVNVWKGNVISYGDESFHANLHKRSQDQISLVVPGVEHLPSEDPLSPTMPLINEVALEFMKLVTPSAELEASIESNPSEHLERMHVYTDNSLVSTDEDPFLFVKGLPGAVSDVKVKPVYAQTPFGLQNAWKLYVEMTDNYYEATVSSQTLGQVFNLVDWVSDSSLPLKDKDGKKKDPKIPTPVEDVDATYLVFPWGTNDPEEGNRTIVQHSKTADKVASPYGWHSIPLSHVPEGLGDLVGPIPKPKPPPAPEPLVNFTVTAGNNVFAQENFAGRNDYLDNFRPDAGAEKKFVWKYDPVARNDSNGRMEEARKHVNATITQLFVTSNLFHDLMYRYGFDEISGNFQQYNFGKGGKEDDAVIANAQDGSGFNNANFMTPPDGTAGRMRMYLWNTASPYRDGDFEAGIVIHELGHGLSTRLTGGPEDSSCLAFGESGGMGEGWGDFLATTIRSTSNYSDYPMGAWAANSPKGIRNYPYSLNRTVNPETYKAVDKYFGVHPIGEVWAEMLWVVLQRLIKKHGFTDSLFPPTPAADGTMPDNDFYRPAITADGPLIPKHGNSLMVQLVVSGMKLQKCRPDFIDARNAIIQADSILTNGENFCDIWAGFAERGLGEDAKVIGKLPWGGGIRTDGFSVPLACAGKS